MSSLFIQPAYAITFVVVLVIWATPDVIDSLTRRAGRRREAVVRETISHELFRVALSLALITAVLLAHFRPLGTLPYHRPYLFVLGSVMALGGLLLRRWAIHTLGRYFTVDVAVSAGQPVVDAPPYRRIRHPAYSGSILSIVGTAIMLGHWLGVVLVALAVVVSFSYRVRLEERALLQTIGQPYADYMRRTKRFVPFVW